MKKEPDFQDFYQENVIKLPLFQLSKCDKMEDKERLNFEIVQLYHFSF